METHLLGYQSPLYGRRTGQILLPPLKYYHIKYSTLKFKDALDILAVLKEKSGYVDWNTDKRKEYFGLIAKKIEGKERLRKEGYIVFDFDDF